MTAAEKAKELVDKFILIPNCDLHLSAYLDGNMCAHLAKQCALILVEEINKVVPLEPTSVDWDEAGGNHGDWYYERVEQADKYWNEVKSEIEKL